MENPQKYDREVVLATLNGEYDITPAEGFDTADLVEQLKACFEESIEQEGVETRFRCDACEQPFFEPPDAPRDECPFCGRQFADADDGDELNGVGAEVSVAGTVGRGLEEMDTVLRECRTLEDVSKALQVELVNLLDHGYRLGWLLKTVRDRELWRMGDGYKTFRDYYESIGIRHSTAYDLMKIVDVFTYGDFITIGRAKLAIVASVPPEHRGPLLDAARDGASRNEIKAMAEQTKTSSSEPEQTEVEFVDPQAAAGAKPLHEGPPPRPPRVTEDESEGDDGEWATLVTKIKVDVPVEIPFLSRRRRGEETIQFDPNDVYLERVISPRIAIQIELNTDEDNRIRSATWTWRKTE